MDTRGARRPPDPRRWLWRATGALAVLCLLGAAAVAVLSTCDSQAHWAAPAVAAPAPVPVSPPAFRPADPRLIFVGGEAGRPESGPQAEGTCVWADSATPPTDHCKD